MTWTDKITESKKIMKSWREQFRVELARDFFDGKQRPSHVPASEWITLNKIYAHLMAQLPSLYSVDPYFYVKLKKSYSPDPQQIAQWDIKAKGRQAYLNYLKGEIKLKEKARLAIQDAHFSFGAIKTFYEARFKKNERAGEPMVDELGEPIIGEDGKPQLEPEEIPLSGRYCVKRVHPDNIIFGCESGVLEDSWSWIGEIFTLSMGEAKKDNRFSKKVLKDIEGKLQNEKKKDEKAGDKKIVDVDEEIVEFVEIYDLKKREWFIWTEHSGELAMKARKIPAAIETHPYSILRFVLRGKDPLPIPPMSQGIEPQIEYNTIRSQIMTHRKRFNRKYEVNVNALTDESEISKLESGEDGTIIKKQTADRAVSAIQDAPLDVQRYTELGILNQDLNELLGTSDNARLVSGASSATEASILDNQMNIKEGDKLSIVVDWLTDIAKKLDKLAQVYMSEVEAVKIIGPEGEFWAQVNEVDYDEIHGEYEYSINIGSTQSQLPQIERSQFIAFFSQVVIPMPAILTKPQLMKKLAAMFGIEDESMIEELRQLGMEMIQNPPQPQGSQPNISNFNPASIVGGQSGGFMGGASAGV